MIFFFLLQSFPSLDKRWNKVRCRKRETVSIIYGDHFVITVIYAGFSQNAQWINGFSIIGEVGSVPVRDFEPIFIFNFR